MHVSRAKRRDITFLPFYAKGGRRSAARRAMALVRGSVALLAMMVVVAACSPAAVPTPTSAPATPTTAAATTPTAAASPTTASTSQQATPTTATSAAAKPTAAASKTDGQTLRFRVDPTQSEARFRVREQLAGQNAPNDAVGVTKAIEGELVVRPDGTFDEGSNIVVDLQTLKSDESRRDRFIATNTLQVTQFPKAEFVPLEMKGLPQPLPVSGPVTFQLVGKMKVHGVEKEVTWDVDGTLADDVFKGKATTSFQFADFGMEQPRVAMVLSVEDDIRLEMDLVAQRVEA